MQTAVGTTHKEIRCGKNKQRRKSIKAFALADYATSSVITQRPNKRYYGFVIPMLGNYQSTEISVTCRPGLF